MQNDLFTGLILGGAIYVFDMMFNIGQEDGISKLMRMFLEGMAVFSVYEYSTGGFGGGSGTTAAAGSSRSSGGIADGFLMNSILTTFTLFFTDFLLKPEMFRGFGFETMKFWVQGFIVMVVLNVVA